MSDLRDVEICRLQEEVRCVRAEIERLKADNTQASTAYIFATNRAQYYEAEVKRLTSMCADLGQSAMDLGKQLKEKEAEIEYLKCQNEGLLDRLFSKTDPEIERLREAHERIVSWSHAYPLAVFPKPDLKKAHKLLQAGGMTLDAISAEAMRHVIEQVAKISGTALEHKP